MSRTIPLIKLRDNLVVSIQIELSDRLVAELKDNVAAEIRKRNTSGLVIEVSGVDIFDSYIARSIQDIAQIAALMGTHTVLAGLDSAMAITLVEMGMSLNMIETALDLDSALDLLALRATARAFDDSYFGLDDGPAEQDEDLLDEVG